MAGGGGGEGVSGAEESDSRIREIFGDGIRSKALDSLTASQSAISFGEK